MSLLTGVLLLAEVLLAAGVEMVLVVSGSLAKKGTIPRESVTLEEEEVMLSFDALLMIWYSWDPFSLLG
jgi:hypothetical protein